MKNIIWLCSYPKSGNTWLRLIICGLYYTKNGIIDNFEILRNIKKFDSLEKFEFIKKISKKDFDLIFANKNYDEETLLTYSKYWIEAQKKINLQSDKIIFFKTHNARVKILNNYYTNEKTSLGFIYLIRDPRDIVISYSKYLDKNYDEVIDFMINGQLRGNEKKDKKMPEILLNWQDNYISWKKFENVPRLFIKYENLVNNIEKELMNIIIFFKKNFNIEINNTEEKINNIIASTNIKNLQLKEQESGFSENTDNKGNENFFRKGKISQWKTELKNYQIMKIEKNFEKTLKELEYI